MPIAFLMVVLAGTEQAAQAAAAWVGAARIGAGDSPDQSWGSARGRGHEVSLAATEASATGGTTVR
ncbi:hypothetical protein ACFXPY_37045 [Streptomyces sp. NPDC059153]|uniref:hypothetical protein n=1 Tax=Streptomyces sp. NPDC059153 TaxID=3346743 RepID=UPI0036A66241